MTYNGAVLFDMDGVIFDSERLIYAQWVALSEKYGFKDMDKIYPKCIGATYETDKKLFKDFYGRDFPYDEYRREHHEEYIKKYGSGNLPLKEGIRELLTCLREKNYYIAVASSTYSDDVLRLLKSAGLSDFFDKIVGGEMVKRSKPNPDIFLYAAEGCGIPTGEIYVIEDSFNGVRAAHNAKMKGIMVPDMVEPDDEIRGLAYKVFDSLLDVKAFLESAENRNA